MGGVRGYGYPTPRGWPVDYKLRAMRENFKSSDPAVTAGYDHWFRPLSAGELFEYFHKGDSSEDSESNV